MSASEKLDIKNLSDRVSIAHTENILSIVIIPIQNIIKLYGLVLWILAWTICGLLIISSYKIATNSDQKLFIIIFTSFWSYYEWKIINAFTWKKWGKEKIWIKDKTVFIEQSTIRNKKTKKINIDDINDIQVEEFNEKSFSDFMSNSFWNKGKPRIKINALGKDYFFGYQLSDEEAKKIVRAISKKVLAQKNI